MCIYFVKIKPKKEKNPKIKKSVSKKDQFFLIKKSE